MGCGGMVVGSWRCHHDDCSRHTLMTEHRPVTSIQHNNPTTRTRPPLGLSYQDYQRRLLHTLPSSLHPHPPDGKRLRVGCRIEHEASLSMTSGRKQEGEPVGRTGRGMDGLGRRGMMRSGRQGPHEE